LHLAPARPAAPTRGSILDPYEPAIRSLLDDTPDLLAPAVLERLRPIGYTGGVTILRDRLRRLRPSGRREAFLTLDFPAGEAMQIDWADFGFAVVEKHGACSDLRRAS
jgi:transposase